MVAVEQDLRLEHHGVDRARGFADPGEPGSIDRLGCQGDARGAGERVGRPAPGGDGGALVRFPLEEIRNSRRRKGPGRAGGLRGGEIGGGRHSAIGEAALLRLHRRNSGKGCHKSAACNGTAKASKEVRLQG